MSASKLLDRVLASGVSAALREDGFKRKGRAYRRRLGGVWNVVEVQLGRHSVPAEAVFVLNSGAYHANVEQLLHATVVDEPAEFACTVRTRVGPASRLRDPWWDVHADEEADVARLVIARVHERVLPWLRMASDLSTLSDALDAEVDRPWTPNLLAPAAVALALGRKEVAVERIASAVESIRARRAELGNGDRVGIRVLELAERLRREHGLT